MTCGQCGKALPEDAVSDDFCGEICQAAYHRARSIQPRVVAPSWEYPSDQAHAADLATAWDITRRTP